MIAEFGEKVWFSADLFVLPTRYFRDAALVLKSLAPFALGAMLAIAGVATLVGAGALINFDSAPGAPATPPRWWPSGTKIARGTRQTQIVVFAHPRCSCTAATIEELSKINGAQITFLFFRPNGESDWPETPSWKQARALPGATVLWDDGGNEAKRFGSSTSGTVLVYGKRGDLLFDGGVTGSRGHVGDNFGFSQFQAVLRTGQASDSIPPVFGCSLNTPPGRARVTP